VEANNQILRVAFGVEKLFMKTIKIAGTCLNQTPLDWAGNLQNIIQVIEAAKRENVAVLCLPELCITGYGCEDTFFSDYVAEQALRNLRSISRICKDIIVSVGLPLVFENCLYNAVCLIQDTRILGFVAKQQLAGDGIHYEPRWFRPWPEKKIANYLWEGNVYPLGDLVFEIDGVRIGFEICEDAWNGIRPAQQHYVHNVDIILNPSASHFAFGKSAVREGLVREASRSFSCTYVYSNLLGNEAGRIIFDGEILIAQQGILLGRNKRFSFKNWHFLATVVDIDLSRRNRKKSFGFQPSVPENLVRGEWKIPEAGSPRRHSLSPTLSKEEEFYQALTLGLFDYMRKSYSKGFVISLSGGADSGACAVLSAHALRNAVREIGFNAVRHKLSYWQLHSEEELFSKGLTCLYQATENSGKVTLKSAREIAENLDAQFLYWEINSVIEQYKQLVSTSLDLELNWEQHDIPLQNIQARVRAPGLWMVANLKGALLLATSNRSEAAVGYTTMDGDTAGGLSPLGGIDKAFLLHWLRWAEEALQLPALRAVTTLPPTAELRPPNLAQTDEGDLMPYLILDKIERAAIHEYKSPLEVFRALRGITEDSQLLKYINKFFILWSRNQWKRERYAPSFHVDDANLDPRTWCRFPILNGQYRKELDELATRTASNSGGGRETSRRQRHKPTHKIRRKPENKPGE
jgi:NAD+ synthase (glutamine-hydrolysing)